MLNAYQHYGIIDGYLNKPAIKKMINKLEKIKHIIRHVEEVGVAHIGTFIHERTKADHQC